MNNTPIYIISASSDTAIAKLTVILQTLDLNISTVNIGEVSSRPDGIVLLDVRNLEVDQHGIAMQSNEIRR